MTTNPRYVYIAGPYSKGDTMHNIRQAIVAASMVRAAGHWPYVPHLSGLWDLVVPLPYEEWLALDSAWLRWCDVVVVLPGESGGVRREIALASSLGIPVVMLAECNPMAKLHEWLQSL